MKRFIGFYFLLQSIIATGQTVNYNDVAVIVNDNSQNSIAIGNYFQQARNVPEVNMIHINCSTAEEIDSTEMLSISQQISAYLLGQNIQDSINYIVTTKGVPLKVLKTASWSPTIPYIHSSAVDSEIALILSTQDSLIGANGVAANPYYNSGTDIFSRDDFGIYLVTRLTGFSLQDVYNAIDRSGPNTLVNPSSANFVFDIVSSHDPYVINDIAEEMLEAIDTLNLHNWLTIFDSTYTRLINLSNVVGYMGFITEDSLNEPNFNWTNGSIAYLGIGNSAGTFSSNSNPNFEPLLANLIAEGATGGLGSVYLTYISDVRKRKEIFELYGNPLRNFNLAEAMYANIDFLSQWSVVVGDPKASIKQDYLASAINSDINEFIIYPNPIVDGVLNFTDMEIETVKIYNLSGQVVYHKLVKGIINSLSLDGLDDGTYLIEFLSQDKRYVSKFIKQ